MFFSELASLLWETSVCTIQERGDHPGHSCFLLQYCNKKIHKVPESSCFTYQKAQNFCSIHSSPTVLVTWCYFGFCVLVVLIPLLSLSFGQNISSKIKDLFHCSTASSPGSSILQYAEYTDTLLASHTCEPQLFFSSPVWQHSTTVFKLHSFLATQQT